MQIQVNSDNHIAVNEELIQGVEAEVHNALERFTSRITRVEVHLTDSNAGKSCADDKHCLMEARPAGHDPVAATGKAPDLNEAIREAGEKLQRLLSSLFGRLEERPR